MNIIYATDQYWPSISGVSVSIDSFKRELEAQGHHVYLMTPDYPGATDLDDKMGNKNVFRFKSYRLLFNDENRLVYRRERKSAFRVMDSLKPDIIHVHTEFTMGKIASVYARKRKVPLVITAHTNWEELIHLYLPFIPTTLARLYCRHRMRKRYNVANTVVVPTSLMELLLNLYFVCAPLRVIPTGINRKELENNMGERRTHDRATDAISDLKEQKILLLVGRLGKEKNILFLFDVLEQLLLVRKDVKLIISGDGPARKELEEAVTERGLDGHVVFTGFVERHELKDFYRKADVLVSASKVESQGLVPLEAMVFGTPVVAIGKMGTREVMGGDNGGFMVDDDLDMFTEKVAMLLNNPELHHQKSIEAVKHVEKWSMTIQGAKMIGLYKSLCNNNNHR